MQVPLDEPDDECPVIPAAVRAASVPKLLPCACVDAFLAAPTEVAAAAAAEP